ncbi:MAG: hypothetical protein JW867_02385 [Candidatus Omnitrophica bacterium]|nr:hypothetical protein [Candidatus Omnitrophota bacterium]
MKKNTGKCFVFFVISTLFFLSLPVFSQVEPEPNHSANLLLDYIEIEDERTPPEQQRPKYEDFEVETPMRVYDNRALMTETLAPLSKRYLPKSSSDSTITLDVKSMDVVDVLKILADKGKLNLSISGNIRGRITLFLKDINVWDAFEVVIISGNLAYEKKGEVIYVMPEKDYEAQYGRRYWDSRTLKVYELEHAKATKTANILTQVASKVGKVITDESTNSVIVLDIPEKIAQMDDVVLKTDKSLETRVFNLNYMAVANLEEKLSELISQDTGSMRVNEITNNIIVTDYPSKLEKIEKVISAFDQKPMQVLINAMIIELRPSKEFYQGINWDYWINKYFRVSGDFNIPSPSGISDQVSFGTIGETNVTRKGDYSAIIDFLEIFGKTKIISSPRILALNNQEAKILVGTKDAYITSSVSQIGESAVTTQTVNFVDVGVKLYVTPTINHEDYITLKIRPEISSSERETITTDDKSTEVPIVTTSEAETTVIVKDGVSIILGGLKKVTREKEERHVPVLHNIPLIGMFFKKKADDWSKDELVIVLTPQIVSGDMPIERELGGRMFGQMGEGEALDEVSKEALGSKDEGDLDEEKLQRRRKDAVIEQKMQEKQDVVARRYYMQVLERIQNTAASFSVGSRGNVTLQFAVDARGLLMRDPVVVSSGGDDFINSIAVEIVKRSSPFRPFPPQIKEKSRTFEVLLTF